MPIPAAACNNPAFCVVVGTVAVGAVIYQSWKNTQTGEVFQIPLEPTPMPSRANIDSDWYNIPGKRETHAVADPRTCYDMANKFQKQGRRLKLAKPPQFVGGRTPLPYLCIFEGEDAQGGYFNDNRQRDR